MVVVVAQLQVQEGFEVMLWHIINILNIIQLIHNYAIDRILTTNH